MGLLAKATNMQAYAKVGFLGFPGTGKTFTATEIAIGLARLSDNRPVAFFDTETGSDFMVRKFHEAGIELLVVKSRAFKDLVDTAREAMSLNCSCLIVDSISHVWRELCDAYQKRLNRTKLQFQDWGVIKGEWQTWTDLYVNSPMHMLVLGRAGYEYDYDSNEDGSRDLVKTGTKMKVESEFGFEPSLLIEMERVSPAQDELEKVGKIANIRQRKMAKQNIDVNVGSGWIHRAHILKDRCDVINGKVFDNPTFEDFLPHIQLLNIGGTHLGVNSERNSQSVFQSEDRMARERTARRKIALETIQGALVKLWPGQSAEEKRYKNLMIEVAFDGCLSWTNVEKWPLDDLVDRSQAIKRFASTVHPMLETAEKPFDSMLREEFAKAFADKVDDTPHPAQPASSEDMDEPFLGEGENE